MNLISFVITHFTLLKHLFRLALNFCTMPLKYLELSESFYSVIKIFQLQASKRKRYYIINEKEK